jgi:hypothetical protein
MSVNKLAMLKWIVLSLQAFNKLQEEVKQKNERSVCLLSAYKPRRDIVQISFAAVDKANIDDEQE